MAATDDSFMTEKQIGAAGKTRNNLPEKYWILGNRSDEVLSSDQSYARYLSRMSN